MKLLEGRFFDWWADYHFVSIWHIKAPKEKVWQAIFRYQNWPKWWKAVESAQLITHSGNKEGIGSQIALVFKGALPYRLKFTTTVSKIHHFDYLEGASSGELAGVGRWELVEDGEVTIVHYYWDVQLNKVWLRIISPLIRPILVWNHNIVMREGEKGLRSLLKST